MMLFIVLCFNDFLHQIICSNTYEKQVHVICTQKFISRAGLLFTRFRNKCPVCNILYVTQSFSGFNQFSLSQLIHFFFILTLKTMLCNCHFVPQKNHNLVCPSSIFRTFRIFSLSENSETILLQKQKPKKSRSKFSIEKQKRNSYH